MTAATLRHCAHLIRHFTATRALEVLALQASPLLGIVLGGYRFDRDGLLAPALLALGSVALTAHIFVFNDWAGYESDLRDPLRSPQVFSRHGIARHEVAWTALLLLVLALAALAGVSLTALAFGGAIASLGLVYSGSPVLGKNTPLASSLNHLLGGSLHFLLGYTLAHGLDASGMAIGLFFGLVFAAGHLNQEVRDYDGDRVNGIRTNAVVFGRRRAFVASFLVFTASYALLAGLAAVHVLPSLLRWSPVVWLLHLAWFLRALRRGLDFDTAQWMQRRYRTLFALIGLVMLAG